MPNFMPVLIGTAMTAAAIGFGAATAHATFDYANQPAGEVVSTLKTMGYSVQINGTTNNMPLSATVVVDVSCANGNNSGRPRGISVAPRAIRETSAPNSSRDCAGSATAATTRISIWRQFSRPAYHRRDPAIGARYRHAVTDHRRYGARHV